MVEEGGVFEDDGKADGKEATDEYENCEANNTDLTEGGGNTIVDTQDADCEPFVKEDGPSDDDTTEENLENKGGQDKGGKTKPGGKQNNPEPVRKSARKRRAPTRY